MPLREGCSKSAFKENMKKMIDEGKSEEQAFAIAASKARKNKRKCGEKRQREIERGEFL